MSRHYKAHRDEWQAILFLCVLASLVTMAVWGASGDAKPVPPKNEAHRVTFALYDNKADLVSGATGLDSECDCDAAGFSDCTAEATEIATSSGVYYLDLTAGEMNCDTTSVTVDSNAKPKVIVFYPVEATDIPVNIEAISGDTTAPGNLELGYDGTGYVGGAIRAEVDIQEWDGLAFTGANMVEDDAGTMRFTTNALEQAGGSGTTPAAVWGYATRILTALDEDDTTLDLDATTIGIAAVCSALTGHTNQTADHTAGIADIPTVAEFNARTLVAGSYFDPAVDPVAICSALTGHTPQTGDTYALASGATGFAAIEGQTDDIGVAGAGLTDLGGMSTGMKAEVEVEATDALNAYDPPTDAEMIARTRLTADYFDQTSDPVEMLDSGGTAGTSAAEMQTDITGGAYAINTNGSGYVRLVDGTGTGEVNLIAGKVISSYAWSNTSLVAVWTVDSGTTTTLVDLEATPNPPYDDFWVGNCVYITGGDNTFLSRAVSAYDATTGTFTFSKPFPEPIAAGNTYVPLDVPCHFEFQSVLLETTVETVNGTLNIDLVRTIQYNDQFNNQAIVILDVSDSNAVCANRRITDTFTANNNVRFDEACDFTVAVGDIVRIIQVTGMWPYTRGNQMVASNATGHVGPNFTDISGTLDAPEIGSNAITAIKIAADAIGDSELSDAAIAKIQSVPIGTARVADSGSTTTITDAALTETDPLHWVNGCVMPTEGTMSGQVRRIVTFDPATDTITVFPPFTAAITTEAYTILADGSCQTTTAGVGHSGTAQAGASGQITLAAAASSTDNYYKWGVLRTTAGTGAGQAASILTYDGTSKVATIAPDWRTNPDATTQYTVEAWIGK